MDGSSRGKNENKFERRKKKAHEGAFQLLGKNRGSDDAAKTHPLNAAVRKELTNLRKGSTSDRSWSTNGHLQFSQFFLSMKKMKTRLRIRILETI